jgi:metallo-beta-lactamase family protein
MPGAVFVNAGHIIGACSIELTIENKVLVFSGMLVVIMML